MCGFTFESWDFSENKDKKRRFRRTAYSDSPPVEIDRAHGGHGRERESRSRIRDWAAGRGYFELSWRSARQRVSVRCVCLQYPGARWTASF